VDTGPFAFKESMMAKTRLPYAAEFRRQMVELVRAGRTPEGLASEFEPTAQSIRNWVAQSERNAGHGDGGLMTAEREELNRLRRENRQLRLEREILSKAAAWFARETNANPVKGSGS
jgi:transposase